MTAIPLPSTWEAINVRPRLWWDVRADYCEASIWVEFHDQSGPFTDVCTHIEHFHGPLAHEQALDWMNSRMKSLPFELT